MKRALLLLPLLLASSCSVAQGAGLPLAFRTYNSWKPEFRQICKDVVDLRQRVPADLRSQVDEILESNRCSRVTSFKPGSGLGTICERMRAKLGDGELTASAKEELSKSYDVSCNR